MKQLRLLHRVAIVVFSLVWVIQGAAWAGDLDDGISKFTDDSVGSYDEMGKADQNIKFIVLNAKSKAAAKGGSSGTSGDSSINSVILGAGSKVSGDIYIIDQSKGGKTNVAD